MTTIPQPQLRQLQIMYAAIESANRVVQAGQAVAQDMVAQYLTTIQVLTAEPLPPGASVHVDFQTGEVRYGTSEQRNGVQVA